MGTEITDAARERELADLAKRGKDTFTKMGTAYRKTVGHVIDLGEILQRAKELCEHGGWLPWLRENFELSESTAQRYMLFAREADANPALVQDLTVRTVRKGLVAPAAPKPRTPEIPEGSTIGQILKRGENTDDDDEPEQKQLPAPKIGAGKPTSATIALDLIETQPGITIPELAARMGVAQNRLYRVLPGLEQEQKIHKQGRGWYPGTTGTATVAEPVEAEPEDDTTGAPAGDTADPPIIDATVVEDDGDGEPRTLSCPDVLTAVEERKWDVAVQQLRESESLMVEAGEHSLSPEATMNALRDASNASRRAAATLAELAQSVEKRSV